MASEDERPAKSRDSGEEPEERTDGWMATYSDMVTLLFTFFVLMFAISNVDAQKFALVAASLSRDGLTPERLMEIEEKYNPDSSGNHDFDPSDPHVDIDDPGGADPGKDPSDVDDLPGQGDGPGGGFPGLINLHEHLITYISDNRLEDSISVQFDGEYLLLRLANDVWFASGSADITPPMIEKATVLGSMLADTIDENNPFEIVIAGHTDNVPISTARYPSNWHVSVQRAVNFLEVLIRESGLDPEYFSARGLGETHPIDPLADNDLEENRQKNRRVEVLVSLVTRNTELG